MAQKYSCPNCGCKHFRLLVHVSGLVEIECIECGEKVPMKSCEMV
ncbi:MAG: hypothetical protein ABFC78_02880 [Methanoregula sp.]